MEADQSWGPRLNRWGLCTVSLQGELGTRWGARRRRAREEKGLSRSEVKGPVLGLMGAAAPAERRKADLGVLMSWVAERPGGRHTLGVDRIIHTSGNDDPRFSSTDFVFMASPLDSTISDWHEQCMTI